MVQPTLEYRVCEHFGLYAGARVLSLTKNFSFNVSGDVGGFGVSSDLTWQAFPCLNWRIARHASLQVGYRFVYADYETGSGANRFQYDMLTSGPQLGATFHF